MTRPGDAGPDRHSSRLLSALKTMVGHEWLLLFVIFLALYGPFLLNFGWRYIDIPNVDLPSFHAAAVTVFQRGESPYNFEHMRLMESDTRVFPYLYPPPSLLFFFPLSTLTYAGARHAVLLLNHLMFLVLVWAIPRHLVRARPGDGVVEFATCLVYALSFYPVVVTLNHGQVNILLLAFLVLFWLLARAGKPVWAGLFLALAIVLKTYPLVIVPLLFLIRRWREGVYALAWAGLATVVSFLVLPDGIWHDWITNVMPSGGYIRTPAGLFSPAGIWNQSLNGFFARALTESAWSHPGSPNPGLARLLTYGAAGFISAVTAFAAWRSRTMADGFDRTVLVALPAMYLISPFSWEHHLVYLLPSIVMVLCSRSAFGFVPGAIFSFLSVGSAILIAMPSALVRFKFYGVVVLWVLCVVTASSDRIALPRRQAEVS